MFVIVVSSLCVGIGPISKWEVGAGGWYEMDPELIRASSEP